MLAFLIVTGIGVSLLLTRLFVAAGGSVLVVAVAHGSLNAFSDRLADIKHLLGDPLVVSMGGLVGFALMAVAVVAVYGRRSAHSRRGPGKRDADDGAISPAATSTRAGAPNPAMVGAVTRAPISDYKDTGLHEHNRGLFPPR